MKTRRSSYQNYVKAALIIAAVAIWTAAPLLNDTAEAGGVPILVRTANLSSPTGSINPHGTAQYEVYANGNREMEVEFEDVNLPAGTKLSIIVDGSSIGQIVLSADQRGRLDLRTQDGQTVPVTNDGSVVQVQNGSTVLIAGVLGGGGPNPTPSPSPTSSPTASPTASPTTSPSPSPTSTPNPGNRFAGLSGATINGVLPFGYAEFEVHSSRLELEVRLRQINLPTGTQLGVVVDSISVGSMFVESDREARLRLRSDRGEPVPPVVVGSTITIQNAGVTIMNGIFAGFAGPSPSPSPSPTGTPGPTPSPSPSLGRSFEAQLNGNGMEPPVTTPANGEVKVTLNDAETQATIFGEFHNLSSDQTSGRIETLTGNATTIYSFPVLGGRNGNFAAVTINVSGADIQQLRTGLWSVVLTSVNNPGGEIRGRLFPRSNSSDFNGDGTNDFAVFRPSTGVWYTQNSSGITATSFGAGNDKVVSADYDGDGKTDTAVVENVNGSAVWAIKRSSDGGITAFQFGFASDVPLRGDFDGDGISDLSVYRPSTGVWYILNSSSGQYTIIRYGIAEDIPIPLDLNGDGRDEIVVFRPSTGVWYWYQIGDGSTGAVKWGLTGDIPVRGDFDGDGKHDVTVYRPSSGVWYSLKSSNGEFMILKFGLSEDIPVAGIYDNDSKTDVAVFRPSTGFWYILRSTDGTFQALPFGLNGDIPVVAH